METGNIPSIETFKDFKYITRLRKLSDLRMLKRIFFNAAWTSFYEFRILKFCNILKQALDARNTHRGVSTIIGTMWIAEE